MKTSTDFIPHIGLEIHLQLKTKTKLFSAAKNSFAADANSNVSYLDLAIPGALPLLNCAAVKMAIKFGRSINAKINKVSTFDRKNYFYPDLPKGYQITQFFQPLIQNGVIDIDINGHTKSINITRAHLEEDTAKLVHDTKSETTKIDFNRAGIPLLEIVTAPDFSTADEVVIFLKQLRAQAHKLAISDVKMEQGSFRVDVNISISNDKNSHKSQRVEIKNINSFRFIKQAINYEIKRQIDLLQNQQPIEKETRAFDSKQRITKPLRSKEEIVDYRYFPDPDLPPLIIPDELLE